MDSLLLWMPMCSSVIRLDLWAGFEFSNTEKLEITKMVAGRKLSSVVWDESL
jgi:hypothetical protein